MIAIYILELYYSQQHFDLIFFYLKRKEHFIVHMRQQKKM